MANLYTIMFICLAWGEASLLLAQNLRYPFEHYDDKQGLSSAVRKIEQDPFGFLWLATADGLYRYDGKTFKAYRSKLGDTTGIPNNIINDLCINPNGRLWVATNGGLCYYSNADPGFHQIKLPYDLETTDKYRIHNVTFDYFGRTWFTTKTGIHLLDENDKLQESIRLPIRQNHSITEIHMSKPNVIYSGTNTGEFFKIELCESSMTSVRIKSVESEQLKLLTTITGIYAYEQDTMLVTSWYGGVHKIVNLKDTLNAIPIINAMESDLQRNVVLDMAQVAKDKWWIVTFGSGIATLNLKENRYYGQIKHSIADPLGLSNDYINDIFVDKTGIIWLGTDDGLNKYDRLSHQFFSLELPVQKKEKSVYRRPSVILEDLKNKPGKFLWVLVPGVGLYHFDRELMTLEYVPLKIKGDNETEVVRIYDMMYNRESQLLMCLNTAVYLLDEKSCQLSLFKMEKVPELDKIRRIYQSRNGNYWLTCAANGIYCYDIVEKDWQHFVHIPGDSNSLPDNSIFCILEDHENFLWLGTQNSGLCRLDPKNGRTLNFEHDKSRSRTLPDNNVYDLFEDAYNNLWVATENGLARLNPTRNEFKVFTTSEGLSNNDIFFILPDKKNRLWLGTNYGLSVLNPSNGSIINYSRADGLPSNRIDGAAFCCPDGNLFFGSNSMISGCNPENLVTNINPPGVIINSIRVHGQEMPIIRRENKLMPLSLDFTNNNFSADFVALNFTNSQKNKYAYFLEGYDQNWIYCGSQTNCTYTNLPGGNFTFKVKASNNDGIWNEVGDQLSIFVSPPFWNTWWFYASVVGFIIALIYTYFKIKLRQILHLQKLRMDIARDLHDDIGSTLSSINLSSSMADQMIKSGKNPADIFNTIKAASRNAMDMMNDIIWSIKPENDKAEMLINRMRHYASEILEPAGIAIHFELNESSNYPFIPLTIRKDIFMIFKEALNNMAKYSGASQAKVTVSVSKSTFHMIISDNGKGFNPCETELGNGLKNMEERADSLGAEFLLHTSPGGGTSIELIKQLQ